MTNKQLIQQLRDRLPKEIKWVKNALSWNKSYVNGHNDCLKQVHQLLDEMGEE